MHTYLITLFGLLFVWSGHAVGTTLRRTEQGVGQLLVETEKDWPADSYDNSDLLSLQAQALSHEDGGRNYRFKNKRSAGADAQTTKPVLPIVFYSLGRNTFGDLYPLLGAAAGLASKVANEGSVMVLQEVNDDQQFTNDMFNKIVFVLKAFGFMSPSPCVDNKLLKASVKKGPDSEEYNCAHFKRTNADDVVTGEILVVVSKFKGGHANRYTGQVIVDAMFKTKAKTLFVYNSFGSPFACPRPNAHRPETENLGCAHTFDANKLDIHPGRIEVNLCTGDTSGMGGHMIFNVRSSVLFPPKIGVLHARPRPIGMIKARTETDSSNFDAGLTRWFDSCAQNTRIKSTICVAPGSFRDTFITTYRDIFQTIAVDSESCLFLHDKGIREDNPFPVRPDVKVHTTFVDYFPDLFSKCDTVVHAGGAGTTAEIMYEGKAQIILYEAHGNDKENNAKHASTWTRLSRSCSRGNANHCRELREKLVDTRLEGTLSMLKGMRKSWKMRPATHDSKSVISKSIKRASMIQADEVKEKQRQVKAEFGDLSASPSRAQKIVVDELFKVFTRMQQTQSFDVMPIVIYRDSNIPANFVVEVAKLTNAKVAVVGGVQETAYATQTNVRHFASASDLKTWVGTSALPDSDYAKDIIIACTPVRNEDRPYGKRKDYSWDFQYDATCATGWPTEQPLRRSVLVKTRADEKAQEFVLIAKSYFMKAEASRCDERDVAYEGRGDVFCFVPKPS